VIFLKSQNILFLRPRKVASTSFEIALSKFAKSEDIITPFLTNDEDTRQSLGFPGPQNYLYSFSEKLSRRLKGRKGQRRGRKKFYHHMSAESVREKLGAEVFDQAFKVSIIRNPYDALVSMYYWQNKRPKARPSFRDWALQNPKELIVNQNTYLIDGSNVIDFLIRFENFDEDIRKLEGLHPGLSGLADTFSGLSSKTGLRPAKATPAAMFADEPDLAAAVRFYNDFAISQFNYTL